MNFPIHISANTQFKTTSVFSKKTEATSPALPQMDFKSNSDDSFPEDKEESRRSRQKTKEEEEEEKEEEEGERGRRRRGRGVRKRAFCYRYLQTTLASTLYSVPVLLPHFKV